MAVFPLQLVLLALFSFNSHLLADEDMRGDAQGDQRRARKFKNVDFNLVCGIRGDTHDRSRTGLRKEMIFR